MRSDGTFTSAVIPILGGYTARDSNHAAYNAAAGTFFAVAHGNTFEDIGYEISSAGVPSPEFEVTNVGGRDGNFYPRVTAHATRPEWMMTAWAALSFVAGQRVA